MKMDLVKHILYMFRCCAGTAEYNIVLEDPNQTQHMFIVKDSFIGYNLVSDSDVVHGLDCTNLDLLTLDTDELTPVSYRKVLYLYDSEEIYSEETLHIRYEIELLLVLAKEEGNSLYFSLISDNTETDIYFIDKALYWHRENGSYVEVYTASFYDAEKIFGDYSIGWVYGKAPYPFPYKFYVSKEHLARTRGLEYKKVK